MAFGQESVHEKFKSVLPFRGQLTDVRAANNDPEAIVEMAKVGWQAKKQALGLISQAEDGSVVVRPWQNKFGIVRDEAPYPAIDGGKPCSAEFELLKNGEIVADMAKSAKDWGLVITWAGAISDGEFVLAYASSPKLADIAGTDKGCATHYGDLAKGSKQDPVEAGILMVASHQPGFKSHWIPKVVRFLCTNGVVIGDQIARDAGYRVGHRNRQGEGYQHVRVEEVFAKFERDFGEWCDMARDFGRAEIPKVAQKAYLAEVLDPGLWERILMATAIRDQQIPNVDIVTAPHREIPLDELLIANGHEPLAADAARLSRIEVVEGLLGRDQSRRVVEELLEGLAGRNFGQVEELLTAAPGQDGLQGLARPYHALTHWVDHHRGRKGSAAVESQEWGPGAALKHRAGQIGKQWLQDLAIAGGAGWG